MKTFKGGQHPNIKEDRLLKLKMISAITLISDELKLRNLNFTLDMGVFEVSLKKYDFLFQVDDGETITNCWTKLSYDRCFELCEFNISIEDFISDLDNIINDVNKLYKLKDKVEKQVENLKKLIENSDISNIETNDYTFCEMSFENLIWTTDL